MREDLIVVVIADAFTEFGGVELRSGSAPDSARGFTKACTCFLIEFNGIGIVFV